MKYTRLNNPEVFRTEPKKTSDMKPEEKARQLVARMLQQQPLATIYCEEKDLFHNAKQCALICVEEILNIKMIHNIGGGDWKSEYGEYNEGQYWQEVKAKIEKL